jgi:hypothetical protein
MVSGCGRGIEEIAAFGVFVCEDVGRGGAKELELSSSTVVFIWEVIRSNKNMNGEAMDKFETKAKTAK